MGCLEAALLVLVLEYYYLYYPVHCDNYVLYTLSTITVCMTVVVSDENREQTRIKFSELVGGWDSNI
jgi:hypothetical protein